MREIHTGVVGIDNTEDQRPDKNEHNRDPAGIKAGVASNDGEDVVSAALHDIMREHHIQRRPKAQQTVNKQFPSALSIAKYQYRPIGIENSRQIS